MKQLDFRWILYFENICFLGMQGQGKTFKAKQILEMHPELPRWIWSPQRPTENFDGERLGYFCNDVDKLERGFFIYTGEYSEKNFLKFLRKAMTYHDMLIVVDDCHEYCTKQMIPDEWKTLILSGRNRGIHSINLSPFPNQVHNTILGSCQHQFSFKLTLETHIEWVRKNVFGKEAWVLLPRNQRQEDQEQWPDVLPDRSYLYRNRSDPENQLMICGTDFEVTG